MLSYGFEVTVEKFHGEFLLVSNFCAVFQRLLLVV
jgi:hypothetical protein